MQRKTKTILKCIPSRKENSCKAKQPKKKKIVQQKIIHCYFQHFSNGPSYTHFEVKFWFLTWLPNKLKTAQDETFFCNPTCI